MSLICQLWMRKKFAAKLPRKTFSDGFQTRAKLCWLKCDNLASKSAFQPTSTDFPEDVRYNDTNHFLGFTTQGRSKVCKKNTKIMCGRGFTLKEKSLASKLTTKKLAQFSQTVFSVIFLLFPISSLFEN